MAGTRGWVGKRCAEGRGLPASRWAGHYPAERRLTGLDPEPHFLRGKSFLHRLFSYLYIMEKDNRKNGYWPLMALVFVLGLLAGFILMQHRVKGIQPVISYTQGSKIGAVMQIIESNYVDTVNDEQLTTEGLTAILHSLDPHSAYMPPKEYEAAEEEIQGNFQGIGIQFRMIDDTVTVILPVSGGPSERAGILAGDKIIMAGKDTLSGKNMNTDAIVKKLKGAKGTKVDLGLKRNGTDGMVWVTVKRDVIPTYSVDAHFVVEPGIGYVKVSKFAAKTAYEFEAALSGLAEKGVNRLIIDLRSNGGGLLAPCLEMADMLLAEDDVIVYTEGRNRRRSELHATGYGEFQNLQLAVLIDEWSASASEILAGAIQDNDRGVIIGRRSFGKGLVQEQMDLGDGSALRLTVARYYTPSGRCIQKPYDGSYEEYEEDVMRRYLSGEMTGQDSSLHADTARYYTSRGRVVYGGGGIMPDVLLPYKTDSLFVYMNQLSNRGYNYDYSFRYTTENRKELKRAYPSAESFTRDYVLEDDLFEDFIRYTEEEGLPRDTASLAKYGNEIRLTLKALIGRDLYDDAGFYPTYLQRDDDFVEAVRVLKGERVVDGFSFSR